MALAVVTKQLLGQKFCQDPTSRHARLRLPPPRDRFQFLFSSLLSYY